VRLLQTALLDELCRYRNIIFIYSISRELIISWQTISLNPASLCERDTKELFKPMESMVATINLGIDNSTGKRLKT